MQIKCEKTRQKKVSSTEKLFLELTETKKFDEEEIRTLAGRTQLISSQSP
jgi:hypothetical protein